MVVRGAVRLAPAGLMALVVLALGLAFYWATPGLGLANPDEARQQEMARNRCPDVSRSNVCGQVCFYGYCVECNEETAEEVCNECVKRRVWTVDGCSRRTEPECWPLCVVPCGPYDGDDCDCVTWGEDCNEGSIVYYDCYVTKRKCTPIRTVRRDWHNAASDPGTPTPFDLTPAKPGCTKLGPPRHHPRGNGVIQSTVLDDGPLHTRIIYSWDGDTCVEWMWDVRGNTEEFSGRFIPVNRGQVSNLESALVIGSGRLPQYSCREDSGVGAGSVTTFATLGPAPQAGALTGGRFPTREGSSSFLAQTIAPTRFANFSETFAGSSYQVNEVAADSGGPVLSGLRTADSSGSIGIRFRVSGHPDGKRLYLRHWPYSGRPPELRDVPFEAFAYASGGVQHYVDSGTLGVISFQVAYKDDDGGFVKSNTVTGPVGFDWERIAHHVSSTPVINPTAGPTPDNRLVALPTVTRLPTLTPDGGGSAASRPGIPRVRRIEDGNAAGVVRVVLRGGSYTGKLEYRYWPYAGHNRPSDGQVSWRGVTLAGESRFDIDLKSEVGSGGGYFVFEARAVDARGDRSDPTPYYYRWVSPPAAPTPPVTWIRPPGVTVTPESPSLGEPGRTVVPTVVTATPPPTEAP